MLSRRRLLISYYTRSKRSESERVLSPQRLLHYRNTWYLDAWCHASEGLRRFALDAVRSAKVLDEPARELPMSEVEKALDQGYGIFGGAQLRWATLHFSAEAAQWVAQEEWHPQQQLKPQADGSLRMRIPYSDSTELVMDVLRHGPNVRVLSPPELVERGARLNCRQTLRGRTRQGERGMNKAFTKESDERRRRRRPVAARAAGRREELHHARRATTACAPSCCS